MRLGNPGLAVASCDMENGRWFTASDWPIELKIASITSKACREAIEASKLNTERDEETRGALLAHITAEHIVKDWKGLVDENGTEIPFSRENAIAVITDKDNRRLFNWIIGVAMDESKYLVLAGRDDVKN